MNKKLIIALFTLVVVVGGAVGAAMYLSRAKEAPVSAPLATPSPTPTKSPRGLLRAGEQTTELKAVGGYGGDGVATRLIQPGKFTIEIAAKIPEPPPGKFYEVWLIRKSPETMFSIGKLQAKDDSYVLKHEQTRDATTYIEVWVTLETQDDKKPETHVLEGIFGQ